MSLSRWQRSIVTESGDTIAEAEIEVFDAGESTKPDLFQDSDGSTALTNPFNADGSGFAAFYVAGGRYDIAVNGAVIWTNVALGTVQSRDVGTGSDQVPDNATFGVTSSGVVPEMIGQGAIVESDTNANGSYVRWENGEQRIEATFEVPESELDESDYVSGGTPLPSSRDFPATFASRPDYIYGDGHTNDTTTRTGRPPIFLKFGRWFDDDTSGNGGYSSNGYGGIAWTPDTGQFATHTFPVKFRVVAWGYWK